MVKGWTKRSRAGECWTTKDLQQKQDNHRNENSSQHSYAGIVLFTTVNLSYRIYYLGINAFDLAPTFHLTSWERHQSSHSTHDQDVLFPQTIPLQLTSWAAAVCGVLLGQHRGRICISLVVTSASEAVWLLRKHNNLALIEGAHFYSMGVLTIQYCTLLLLHVSVISRVTPTGPSYTHFPSVIYLSFVKTFTSHMC